MPRLIKHSKLERQPSEVDSSNSITTPSASHEPQRVTSLLARPRKMKMRDRMRQFEEKNKTEVEPNSRQSEDEPPTEAEDENKSETAGDIGNYLSRFTDDDASLLIPGEAKRRKSEKRKEIKIKNRMFAGESIQLDGTEEKIQVEYCQLQVKPKTNKPDPSHLMEQMQKRASNFRKKLQFKEGKSQKRLTEDIFDKIKQIEDGQEVELQVEQPKATRKGHIDAALLIKQEQTKSQEEREKDQEKMKTKKEPNRQTQLRKEGDEPKNRKQFYQELGRKLKMKRAESFTEQALKEAFRKSKLDDDDFIEEIKNRDTENSFSRVSRESQSYFTKNSKRQSHEKITIEESVKARKEKEESEELEIEPVNRQILIREAETSLIEPNHTSRIQTAEISEAPSQEEVSSKQQPEVEKGLSKPRHTKMSKKQRKAYVSNLLEEQAENSGEQDKEGQQLQDDEDDGYLSQLIDDQYELDSHGRRQGHRLFVKQALEMDERRYKEERMKAKLRHEEDQAIRQRMKKAAMRNKSQDKSNFNEQRHENKQEESEEADSKSSNARYQQNLKKIKDLEENIGIKIQSQVKPEEQKKQKDMLSIELLQNLKVARAKRQPQRKGLQRSTYARRKSPACKK